MTGEETEVIGVVSDYRQMVDASIEPRPPVLMWPCIWHACIAWHIRGSLNVGGIPVAVVE